VVITYTAQFCSDCSTSSGEKWFDRFKWQNQHGKGTSIELNLLWFSIGLEFYRKVEPTAEEQKALDE
jgi:hypothetical protein